MSYKERIKNYLASEEILDMKIAIGLAFEKGMTTKELAEHCVKEKWLKNRAPDKLGISVYKLGDHFTDGKDIHLWELGKPFPFNKNLSEETVINSVAELIEKFKLTNIV